MICCPHLRTPSGPLDRCSRKTLSRWVRHQVYREIDLPLVPVLLRMEEAGVRIDRGVLSAMSDRLTVEMHRVSEQIFQGSGHRFNINSPKQLGDVLFNKMRLPKPIKYGTGKSSFDRCGCARGACGT